jgi:hypothetical protein
MRGDRSLSHSEAMRMVFIDPNNAALKRAFAKAR